MSQVRLKVPNQSGNVTSIHTLVQFDCQKGGREFYVNMEKITNDVTMQLYVS